MPKSKKTDSEKASKKADKPGKEKKSAGKKAKAADLKPAKPVKVAAVKPKKAVTATAVKPRKAVVTPRVEVTNEEIALRAYYIAERREAMGWPGDSTSDWVEAEAQLTAEALKNRA